MARRTTVNDGPHPLDVHVGKRIRATRKLRGVSQTALGRMVGMSFQQVQKYEKAQNRISASMLGKVATELNVGIETFFAGYADDRMVFDGGVSDDVLLQIAGKDHDLVRHVAMFLKCNEAQRKTIKMLTRALLLEQSGSTGQEDVPFDTVPTLDIHCGIGGTDHGHQE